MRNESLSSTVKFDLILNSLLALQVLVTQKGLSTSLCTFMKRKKLLEKYVPDDSSDIIYFEIFEKLE